MTDIRGAPSVHTRKFALVGVLTHGKRALEPRALVQLALVVRLPNADRLAREPGGLGRPEATASRMLRLGTARARELSASSYRCSAACTRARPAARRGCGGEAHAPALCPHLRTAVSPMPYRIKR